MPSVKLTARPARVCCKVVLRTQLLRAGSDREAGRRARRTHHFWVPDDGCIPTVLLFVHVPGADLWFFVLSDIDHPLGFYYETCVEYTPFSPDVPSKLRVRGCAFIRPPGLPPAGCTENGCRHRANNAHPPLLTRTKSANLCLYCNGVRARAYCSSPIE
jgi:hypothetical protein